MSIEIQNIKNITPTSAVPVSEKNKPQSDVQERESAGDDKLRKASLAAGSSFIAGMNISKAPVKNTAETKVEKSVTEVKTDNVKPEDVADEVNVDDIKSENVTDNAKLDKSRVDEATEKKADSVLDEIKDWFMIEYMVKNSPEVLTNYKDGVIHTESDKNYRDYKTLEEFRHKNPEVFAYMFTEKGDYSDALEIIENFGSSIIKMLQDTPLEQLKESFDRFDLFAEEKELNMTCSHYMNLLILEKYNPEVYDYVRTNSFGLSQFKTWSSYECQPSVELLKNISKKQMDFIHHNATTGSKYVGLYVDNSNSFLNNPELIEGLHSHLSKHKLNMDIELYRGEGSVGMFDTIEIPKEFENKAKALLEQNKSKAKETKITTYTGAYGGEPSTNLYDFLSSKENLTLADVMQLAKYGDDKFINEVLSMIQSTKIIDTRFKSFSVDKGMAYGWRSTHTGNNTTIVQSATVKEGTEGCYVHGENSQSEVILNNTAKEISFGKVKYNPTNDTFELESTVQNIDSGT